MMIEKLSGCHAIVEDASNELEIIYETLYESKEAQKLI